MCADQRIEELAERCRAFLNLDKNWNSYEAGPVSPELVQDGIDLLATLLNRRCGTPVVVPTASGGIQIEWHTPEEDLEIEVQAVGSYSVWHRKGEEEEEFLVLDDIGRIASLLKSFERLANEKEE